MLANHSKCICKQLKTLKTKTKLILISYRLGSSMLLKVPDLILKRHKSIIIENIFPYNAYGQYCI